MSQRRGTRERDPESGLTMLEMIVALAVLGFGIAGVLHAFSSSMSTCRAAESYSLAATYAQQVAAELERRPDLESGRLSGGFADDDLGYTWQADIEPEDAHGLLRTRITVFWTVGRSRRHMDMVTCLRPFREQPPLPHLESAQVELEGPR